MSQMTSVRFHRNTWGHRPSAGHPVRIETRASLFDRFGLSFPSPVTNNERIAYKKQEMVDMGPFKASPMGFGTCMCEYLLHTHFSYPC